MDVINGTATFVIPHFTRDNAVSRRYLNEVLEGIFNQTDSNWRIVIVDDCSPCREERDYLVELSKRHLGKINVILRDDNRGPGYCRNVGIKWAYENNSPIVVFNDADDISNPRRLELVRKTFIEDPEADVVYSTFHVIDENSKLVCKSKLTESILEILEGHESSPPQGENAWIDIGTEKGYTNLTSATAVRTELAYKFPFPPVGVSEDSHTWMRYSAGGGKFVFCPDIPTLYRIPQYTEGSSSRSREGGRHKFYEMKAKVDTQGFREALDISLKKSAIDEKEKDDLLIKFYIKLAVTMAREKEFEVANKQILNAIEISKDKAGFFIAQKGLTNNDWINKIGLG